MNGLATYKDVIKGENFDNGVISIANPDKSDVKFIEKYGNTKHIEEVFEKHRLEKVPKNQTVYCDEIKEEMKYYLFEEKGINDPKHREKLESLLNGIMVERQESLLEYLNKLEEELDTKKDISQLGEPLPVTSVEEPVSNKKAKSRVLSLFKKDKR